MKTSKRFSSLNKKLTWPFALLGLSVSCVLSLTTYLIVADLDERNIRQSLLVELEDFRSRRLRNHHATPITTQLMQGYFLPSNDRPELHNQVFNADELRGRNFRIIERIIENRPRTILIDEVEGELLAIVHDDSGSQQMLNDLAWLMLAATLVMTLLSALLGYRLAGQVVRPISRLLRDINERGRAELSDAQPASPQQNLFTAGKYPDNEIGNLALALDAYAARLMEFIERERYFVGDVSHELRTPIAIIQGAAEIAKEHPELPAAVRSRIELIERKSIRLAELLDALLLLARERELGQNIRNDAACPIAEVIEEVITECQALIANKPIRITCEYADRPLLAIERSMAYVVASNLIRNACIHTEEGQIKVSLSTRQLIIEDTGSGIAAEQFSSIYERYTKSERSPGSGLGLSIVARMIEMMGWNITLQSEPGKGTRVCIEFHTLG